MKSVVPPYPGPYQGYVYVYFVRDCKAKVKLVLEFVRDGEIECCDDDVTISQWWYDKLINNTWHSFSNIYKYVTCGEKCCRRSYYCVRIYDIIDEDWITVVNLPVTESVTICSGNSDLFDCLDDEPIPCEDASCDGY